MAFAVVLESNQVNQSSYDQLMQALGLGSLDAPLPEGAIAHLAGPKPEGGWRVVDVWESEQAADAWYRSEGFGPVASSGMDITTSPWSLYRLQVVHPVAHVG
jgi:hypothetical protein